MTHAAPLRAAALCVTLTALLCIGVTPQARAAGSLVAPRIQAYELSASGAGAALAPAMAQRMLDDGQALLALRIAEEALGVGGSPLEAAQWRRVQASAHQRLGHAAEALAALSAFPPEAIANDAELSLLRADALMGAEEFDKARQAYAEFLVNQPRHAQHARAQLGVALCHLRLGNLEQATLQLNLYAARAGRPEPDVALDLARIELALAQGRSAEALHRLKQLPQAAAQGERAQRARRHLARMEADHLARSARFDEALALLEQSLAAGGDEPTRALHAKLYRDWLAPSATVTVYRPRKRPEARQKEQQACPPALRAAHQRRDWLREALTGPEPLERSFYLRALLEWERREPLGLLQPGGLLTPQGLGFDADALPAPLRAPLAEAALQAGHGEQALTWLGAADEPEADALRLRLLAEGVLNQQAHSLDALLERLIPDARSVWPAWLLDAVTDAMFRFTRQGAERDAGRLRRLLRAQRADAAVDLAARFQRAYAQEMMGERQAALLGYLNLIYGEAPPQPQALRYLPITPRAAAARLLEAQGRREEAATLRRAAPNAVTPSP
ncbi:tetratricopeptide repeat protein [Magnetofaba australis]|uniref:Uncharacterized protein n=1 Tax=Magnetofaba australis IT-1 TaxID=1434232 RepID=A0A1Y2K3K7_9PROT|nr:tetratricopeptide repeat protein [Magnetofaba australis]OSM03938.1 hypothetical protein MAIT1_01030 [Magnetofaba australis IT-1]